MRADRREWVVVLVTTGLLAGTASQAAGLAGYGVRAGLALANLRGDFADMVGADTRAGFTGGGFLRLGLGGPLELQPELLYAMKGAHTKVELTDPSGNLGGTADLTYQLDYLEIPVLLRLQLPGAARTSLLLGPSMGFKVRSRLGYDGPGSGPSGDFDLVEGTDLGLVGGVELGFGAGLARMVLDARYTLGLNDVIEPPSPFDARTGTFAITAGIGF